MGNVTFDGGNVYDHLLHDKVWSVKPWLEQLLDHYKAMLYNGATDLDVSHSCTKDMIKTFNWSGAKDWYFAPKFIWRVNDTDVAGYAKCVHQFCHVTVRNSGHFVPFDQPQAALDMIDRFVNNVPWSK